MFSDDVDWGAADVFVGTVPIERRIDVQTNASTDEDLSIEGPIEHRAQQWTRLRSRQALPLLLPRWRSKRRRACAECCALFAVGTDHANHCDARRVRCGMCNTQLREFEMALHRFVCDQQVADGSDCHLVLPAVDSAHLYAYVYTRAYG